MTRCPLSGRIPMIHTNAEPESTGGRETADGQPASDLTHRQLDAQLVRRFLGGDETAFAAIMELHSGRVFAVAVSVLRNASDAEEIVQDTFIRAHRGLARFRGESSVATWLHHIAINLARNRYWYFHRRHRQDARSLEAPVTSDGAATFAGLIGDTTPDPAREASHREFLASAGDCARRLTPDQQEILAMRNSLDMPYEAIAERLNINIGTVKSRIARARRTLKALMAEYYPPKELADAGRRPDWFASHRSAGILVASTR